MTPLLTYPIILQILIVVVVEGTVVVVAQGGVVDDADLAGICKKCKLRIIALYLATNMSFQMSISPSFYEQLFHWFSVLTVCVNAIEEFSLKFIKVCNLSMRNLLSFNCQIYCLTKYRWR